MCGGPWNNPFHFGNDPDCDPDHTVLNGTFTGGVSWANEQSTDFGRGLQALTDCLVD